MDYIKELWGPVPGGFRQWEAHTEEEREDIKVSIFIPRTPCLICLRLDVSLN